MKMKGLLVLLFAFNFFYISIATDCDLPSDSDVNQLLRNEVDSGGGEGGTVSVRGGPYYTCEVQGTTNGSYQELSVIMEYTASSIDRVGQFEMICQISPDQWGRRVESLTVLSQGTGVTYDGSIGLRTDCSECRNTAGNDNNCVACNPACNSGLMRCTGSGSDDCCVAFEENGVCKMNLTCDTNNFVANSQNDFFCACGLSSCPDGYTLNSTSCTCTLTDICVANNPCNNNGSCTLGSSPDNFTCDCTGTGFMGLSCTDPEPVAMTTSSPVISSTPTAPISSSAVMATPSPSLITSCVDNCSVCLNSTCCSVCNNNYNVTINGCTCILSVRPPLPQTCDDPNCQECSSDKTCCERCEDGYTNDRQDRCKCASDTVTPSTPVTNRPTSPSRTPDDGIDDGGRIDALESTAISVIIPSIILAILVLVILIVLIAYIVYYFINKSGTSAAKAKLLGNPFSGEAHDNPMYVAPESFDE